MKSFLEMWKILEQAPVAAPNQQAVASPNQQAVAAPNQQAVAAPNQAANKNGADPVENDKLKKLLGKNYEQFVEELKQNINDEKFLNFLKAGLEDGTVPQDDVVNFSTLDVPCTSLTPTQNEIDIKQSLFYPLSQSDTQTIVSYIKGGVFAPGGKIVTCGGGKYIIDGHHRWSSLYCMNPNAKIQALDMSAFSDPVLALKVVQISIAATQNKVETQSVKGTNLLKIDEGQLKDYIAKTISENAKQAFGQFSQGQDPVAYAQNYIWNNILSMRKTSQPISGASKRDFMPQTDKGGEFAKQLQQGTVNWTQNQVASTQHEGPSLNEWLILSGLNK